MTNDKQALLKRLEKLYAELSTVSKSYDAEAVAEAITRLSTPNVDELVARAARDFCAELQEDAEGVPQPQLKRLHEALDIWEMVPPERLYDDSNPTTATLAALKWIVEDGSEPDRVRRAARAAIAAIQEQGG